jgi:hypothetical protein
MILVTKNPEMYLGDGVYASFDGYHIWLDLRGQDNTTKIALEPAVLKNLNEFNKAIHELVPEDDENG